MLRIHALSAEQTFLLRAANGSSEPILLKNTVLLAQKVEP